MLALTLNDTDAGKHFITVHTVASFSDGWISSTFLTSQVFPVILVFFLYNLFCKSCA